MTLYTTDLGIPVTTHSMIKTMRMCPKQTEYKYVERLKPRSTGRPLTFGKWMHYLLEAHYKGEDWRAVHHTLCLQYSEMFDEEKEMLGNLPRECKLLMLSYLWHYKNEHWKVHEVEFLIECEWPDGSGIYRGKVDMLIEDDYGLWVVDHKNHKRLPTGSFRLKDSQSALYVWAARRAGIPVSGFIWNYLRTAPPSVPRLVQAGNRFYKNMGDTTYVTFMLEIKKLGLDPDDEMCVDIVNRLRGERYEHGKIQTSQFFQRHVLERDDAVLERMAGEALRTHHRMHDYDFSDRDSVERNPSRNCDFMCSYTRLCEAELYGGMTQNIRRQDFRVADPMEYYNDEKVLDS